MYWWSGAPQAGPSCLGGQLLERPIATVTEWKGVALQHPRFGSMAADRGAVRCCLAAGLIAALDYSATTVAAMSGSKSWVLLPSCYSC